MPAALPRDPAPPVPAEPFGQTGMRQYAGRMCAWVLLAGALSAFAMGHRSGRFTDRFEWQGQGQMLRVSSGGGQLVLDAAGDAQIKGDGSWTYRVDYGRTRRGDRFTWASGLGRTIGVEGAWRPADPDGPAGVLVRVKWWLLACVLLVQPAAFVARRVVARRRARHPDAPRPAYDPGT